MSIVFAILAKQKAHVLPFYLNCLLAQTLDKKQIHLYIRTNDNTDDTEGILHRFIQAHGAKYASVFFDAASVSERLAAYGQHEWNIERFKALGAIRQASVQYAMDHGAHYFVADCDNFITTNVLQTMLDVKGLGVVAPMLRSPTAYSNFHYEADSNGYYKEHPVYYDLLTGRVKGLVAVAVVHCTYFIHNRLLGDILYDDDSRRYEYVIFSDALRKRGIPQYLDNRGDYGFLTFAETAAAFSDELNGLGVSR
jgi:hypothetical protein